MNTDNLQLNILNQLIIVKEGMKAILFAGKIPIRIIIGKMEPDLKIGRLGDETELFIRPKTRLQELKAQSIEPLSNRFMSWFLNKNQENDFIVPSMNLRCEILHNSQCTLCCQIPLNYYSSNIGNYNNSLTLFK